MSLNQALVQKQTQKLNMTPELRQSIELLALSTQDLANKIENELMENPLLTEIENPEQFKTPELFSVSKTKEMENKELLKSTDVSLKEIYNIERSSSTSTYDAEAANRNQKMIESSPKGGNINDFLLEQLRLTDLNQDDLKIAELLISMMDEHGFIKMKTSELSANLNVDVLRLKKILYYIHRLEPLGIGCRDIRHTLYVQALILFPENKKLHFLIKHHIKDLIKLDHKKIGKSMKITEEEIETLLKSLKKLKIFPAYSYNFEKVEYVIPDVIVRESEGNFHIFINDEWIPKLEINDEYKKVLTGSQNQEDRVFLTTKMNNASSLIKAIFQRRQTLEKVISCIIDNQIDFFMKGALFVKPMTLKDISEKLNMHESTISRITTNKYIETSWGIFNLKWFFSSGLKSQSGNMESSRKIHDMLKGFVRNEDDDNPLSDQDIVDLMQKNGIEIARRTVAKYRKILNIPSAVYRKKNKSLREV